MNPPSLGTPKLKMDSAEATETAAEPLPAYAPSFKKKDDPMSPLSPGKLQAPLLDRPMSQVITTAPVKDNFLTREAFAGLVWWQVILGGIGITAIGAGVISLLAGKRK